MTIFDEISKTQDKLERVREKIEYNIMKVSSPRSSVFSDMPKGGRNAGNPLEEYMIKREELDEKEKSLIFRLERQWEQAVCQMEAAKIDKQTQKMMCYRFISRLPWKKCAIVLDKKYANSKWNVNKCFRKYREVLYRIRKL